MGLDSFIASHQADEAIQQAKEHDPECAQTHFLAFKLAVLQEQEEEGIYAYRTLHVVW